MFTQPQNDLVLMCFLACHAGSRQTFKEQEALVYQQLAQLIRDAVWLKSYLAAVMRLEQEAFQHAYGALGPTKGTLPAIPALPPVAEPPIGTPGTPDHGLPITGREPSPQVDLAVNSERVCCH